MYLFGEIFVSPMTLLVKFAFPRNHNAFNRWNHGNQVHDEIEAHHIS